MRNYRLADAMREAGMTQVDLAAEAGVGRQTVCAYVAGMREPKASRASRIARALGTTVESLWPGGEDA